MESYDLLLPLVATWSDRENFYLASVKKYVPGGDLALRIMQQRTFDEAEARFYIVELLGVAEPVGASISSAYMTDDCGTAYFMSPEQHREDRYSFEVDYWAVGVILHKMVMGKLHSLGTARMLTSNLFPDDQNCRRDNNSSSSMFDRRWKSWIRSVFCAM
ncbi:hypothetical protein BT96DRAFT_981910 [Gymnopus androsaceus JB14]|uniref:non-specific serine/threonine protein kinase n=1 Tax=Gymnopus androsaceus JB14 TaxID=1447944 RepID=A0A6A4GJX2_9AGAR|nr:hypothetical protein BT96DRAFT_981910 [Gymnopus androsaceus JB14]